MRRLTAIAIWPLVYFLDFLIYLTGAQSFRESRTISRAHFKRIMQRDEDEVHEKHFNWFWLHS
jgi:hypothetical protein